MKTAFYISLVLTIIGGINWGLIGFFGIDLVAALFGAGTTLTMIVYAIVGVAAVTLALLSANVIVPEHNVTNTRTPTASL